MTLTLTVCEKSPGGPAAQEYSIELQEERLTVRELIRNIVFQQVYNQNTKHRESGQEWDRVIEGQGGKKTKATPEKTIDWAPKYEHALVAFENNQVLILVDDLQLEDLNAFVTVKPTSKVTFLKLIPLIGG